MKIFSGTASKSLAHKIAKTLKTKLSELEIHVFPDEEKKTQEIIERVCKELVGKPVAVSVILKIKN